MAHLISLPLQAPPDTLGILVDFFDANERDAFLSSPLGPMLGRLPAEFKIPTVDLCAYYLYYKKRPGVPGYSNHDEIADRWQQALYEFDGQIEFTVSSLRLIQKAGFARGTIERLGEALGLSVANSIHGLHQADWDRLSETNKRRTLDFSHPWIASDGRQFIQVETKGSVLENNDNKPQTILNHRASIKAKKADATDAEKASSVLYGTIGVLDERQDGIARCWLVDPPAGVPDNAERLKIVARLSFIGSLVSLIAPRSALAVAIQTRLAALGSLSDIGELNGIALRSPSFA